MIKLTQKTFYNETENKTFAYVECLIVNGNYDYRVTFDKETKKRANAWFRSLGFRIGEVYDFEAAVPEKVLEI